MREEERRKARDLEREREKQREIERCQKEEAVRLAREKERLRFVTNIHRNNIEVAEGINNEVSHMLIISKKNCHV